MAYSRRTVLKLVLGGAALGQAACINLSPFGSRKPATSRSERLDYGQLKIYYNDDVVVYLTREFHLVFKDVDCRVNLSMQHFFLILVSGF